MSRETGTGTADLLLQLAEKVCPHFTVIWTPYNSDTNGKVVSCRIKHLLLGGENSTVVPVREVSSFQGCP